MLLTDIHSADVEAGLEALKRLKLEVEVYYASETDDNAMTVCQANHGDRAVIQLGDVTAITTEQVLVSCSQL